MTSAADNELLTRVGAGTPMGALMRRYWLPAALSSELAPAGPALRVRLLGEDLLAFRTEDGTVGLVAERCPHRLASLWLGRNEGGGLRCAYHGWKFDPRGRCVDLPNEPDELPLRGKVAARAYAVRERGGVVWAHLGHRLDRVGPAEPGGPADTAPPLPDLEWNLAPGGHAFLWRCLRRCNWLQALEGDLDSSHLGFLHARKDDLRDDEPYISSGERAAPGPGPDPLLRVLRREKAPRFETAATAAGVMSSARRPIDDLMDYHRISHFLFPCTTLVAARPDGLRYNAKAWVPMDDQTTLVLEAQLRFDRPWTAAEREDLAAVRNPHGFLPATSAPGGAWIPRAQAEVDWLRDRALERATQFSGILGNPIQDQAVQESMGPVVDRSGEHLGPADAFIIAVRRALLDAARDHAAAGREPPGAFAVRPLAFPLSRAGDWLAATRERLARGGPADIDKIGAPSALAHGDSADSAHRPGPGEPA